ncbi:ribosomal protein S18-alanine N-acetyltransferase [Bengtsoniella intestinalis]|uniref:ribosomal protein S18-alanine N-acetyltransferase n=1 Tax=Bengtsoniella intestinalis TaxID=3073143 RepID=UPI00391F4230
MENNNIAVVPMHAEHLDEIAHLEQICFSTPWSRRTLAEELDNACAAFLTAIDTETGAVVGYAGLHVIIDEGYITNIAVFPEHRRKGVAGKLLQVFLDFAEGNGLAFLTLEVRESNAPAIVLYGSRGFRSVGRRKGYYRHPTEDAILMTKEFFDESETIKS